MIRPVVLKDSIAFEEGCGVSEQVMPECKHCCHDHKAFPKDYSIEELSYTCGLCRHLLILMLGPESLQALLLEVHLQICSCPWAQA